MFLTLLMLTPLFLLLRFLKCTWAEYAIFMGAAALFWNMRDWLVDWMGLDLKAAKKAGVPIDKDVPKQYTKAAKRRLTLLHLGFFTVLPIVTKTLGYDLPRKVEVFWNALFYERSILAFLWLATAIGTMLMSHVLLNKFLWRKVFNFTTPTKEHSALGKFLWRKVFKPSHDGADDSADVGADVSADDDPTKKLSALSILGLALGEIGLMWFNRAVAKALFEFWDGMENFAGIVQILVLATLCSILIASIKKLCELAQAKSSAWRKEIKDEALELYNELPTEVQDSLRNGKNWLSKPWEWLKNHRSILLKGLLGLALACFLLFFHGSIIDMCIGVIHKVIQNTLHIVSVEDVWPFIFLLISTVAGVCAPILCARMGKIYDGVHWAVFVLSTAVWNFVAGAAFQRAFLESLLCTVLYGAVCWGIGCLINGGVNLLVKLIKLAIEYMRTYDDDEEEFDDEEFDDNDGDHDV